LKNSQRFTDRGAGESAITSKVLNSEKDMKLSQASRKALCVQVGENAGSEIAALLQMLAEKVDQLERTKVNVTPIVPSNSVNLMRANAEQLV
jgi:hypothetical protein